MDGGTWSVLVYDQFIWRPKTAASSCIIVLARTSTSSISDSSVTSSSKSRSVNTSFPRCAVRSIIWSIGSRNKSVQFFHYLLQTNRTTRRQHRHNYMCPCKWLSWGAWYMIKRGYGWQGILWQMRQVSVCSVIQSASDKCDSETMTVSASPQYPLCLCPPIPLAASALWCWSWEKEGRAVEVVPGI